MSQGLVRARLLIGDHLLAVLTGVVILALVGGVLAYPAHVDPGTDTEQVQASSWSSTGQYAHQARVTTGTSVFDRGDLLRNRASYLPAVAPLLNGTFVYEYQATDGGNLQVELDQTLVLRSVADPENAEPVEYWRLEEPLGARTAESVTPGDSVRAPFSVNVSGIISRIEGIEEELGGTPGETEVVVRSDARISGTRNGEQVNLARSYEMRIDTASNVYGVEAADATAESGEQVRQVRVEATYGPLRTIGGPLLAALALAGLLGLAVGQYAGWFEVTETDRAWLEYAETREEFADWISTGRVPGTVLDGPRISVESLDGLADVAIDSNRRVIEDRDRGLCAVLLDDVVYSYDIPAGVLSDSRTDPLATPPSSRAETRKADETTGDQDETTGDQDKAVDVD